MKLDKFIQDKIASRNKLIIYFFRYFNNTPNNTPIIINGVDVDSNSTFGNPTDSNMGCLSRNESVDLFF